MNFKGKLNAADVGPEFAKTTRKPRRKGGKNVPSKGNIVDDTQGDTQERLHTVAARDMQSTVPTLRSDISKLANSKTPHTSREMGEPFQQIAIDIGHLPRSCL